MDQQARSSPEGIRVYLTQVLLLELNAQQLRIQITIKAFTCLYSEAIKMISELFAFLSSN
jgi:hypothetical protein